MKLLMKLFSILFFIAIGYSVYQLVMVSTSIYSIFGALFLGSDIINLSSGEAITSVLSDASVFSFLFSNILSFIILAIGSSMLQKNDTNKFLRIVPFVVVVGIIISMVLNFLAIDVSSGIGQVLNSVVNVLKTAELFFLPIVCLGNIESNNVVSEITKKIGYIMIFLSIALLAYLWFRKNALGNLPAPYSDNFYSSMASVGIAVKFFTISILVEFACLILSYTTNYAFEITTIDADNVNYEELKAQAEFNAKSRIDALYNKEKVEKLDRSVSEQTGLMNINNQIGQNSNVGQVNDEVKAKTGLIETSFIMSKGPVVNQSLSNQNENNDSSSDSTPNTSPEVTSNTFVSTPNAQDTTPPSPPVNPSLVGFNNNLDNTKDINQ